jgi:ABC-type sugar transport system ATPase subunit
VATIGLRQVGKIHPNGQAAVRDLTLDVANGELLAVVGPSGSGKSTVLRLIAGLETPTSGQVLIDNADVTSIPPQQRDLAMVFQNYALYPHKSVRENLAFGLRIRHVAPAVVEERVRAAAVSLGIDRLLDRKPAQLSGGQRQRVALGRAMVREPKAFLLDEPLSNLDPLLRARTRAELALLHRRLGATMVYVTHDQEEAMTLGTRVAVMRDGRVEQIGPPLEMFQRPATAFVAEFVGSPAMNLWPSAYRQGRIAIATSGPEPIDLGPIAVAFPEGAAMLAGARPHDIELLRDGEGDGHGRVEIVEPLGSLTVVHLRPDNLPQELVRVIVPSDARIGVEDRASFRIRRDRLHLFDAQSGLRLN